MNVSFYCVNFNDEERRSKMKKRFETHNLELNFVPPVYITDPRIDNENINSNIQLKRIWSIMLQHMDSIQHFCENTENEYLIICEDDILLSKDIKADLPSILQNFQELNLDVLLLGYLINFKLPKYSSDEFPILKSTDKYNYYNYPYHLWGSQMYLLSRKHCYFLLKKYSIYYGLEDLNRPYNPDWTLTKDGNKAIIYPLIALEEGVTKTDCYSQNVFHETCFNINYDPSIYF